LVGERREDVFFLVINRNIKNDTLTLGGGRRREGASKVSVCQLVGGEEGFLLIN
jgi:hypothetical protein